MQAATNLDDVYRACDPDEPLAASDGRYVDLSDVRGMPLLAKNISRSIRRCGDKKFHQQLISGHRGCGKSTELLRLKAELEQQRFFVVYIDVEELLDLVNLNYLDILLSIAKQTTEALSDHGISLNETLLDELSDWFSEKIIEKDKSTNFNGSVKTEAEAGTKMPFFKLLGKLTAEIKSSSSRRETTRTNLKHELAVFTKRLNQLLGNARRAVKDKHYQDIVLIVDGLEKMHFEQLDDNGASTHTRLFVDHAEQLKSPQCHIIFTMPISLAYNANLGNDFGAREVIPMVKMDDAGINKLRAVVAERMQIAEVFEDPRFVDELAKMSGGVMRDLMHLIRLATDTDEKKISRAEIDYAKNKLIMDYDRLLREEELKPLRWVRENQRVTGGKHFERMLYLRLILEYQNGKRWADIHPALYEIDWVKAYLRKN